MKIDKWLGVSRLSTHEAFILTWHNFCKYVQKKIEALMMDPEQETYIKQINLFILQLFYGKTWDMEQDFYKQMEDRLAQAYQII